MSRRLFLSTAAIAALTMKSYSAESNTTPPDDPCIPDLDSISAEATGSLRYVHFHRVSIPVSALIDPPQEGFEVRTTTLDQRSLDEVALMKFLKETGLKEKDIRYHSHSVKITQAQLEQIAQGEKNVEVIVKTPKGNYGHTFFFTASQSVLIKIQRARLERK
ncbi:MAG: hypothetical protein IT287_04590 [Bdellovibrionaceae bacterium]|nr:hypothetical protein [Pseudobdellovibrionaceae bacterium]